MRGLATLLPALLALLPACFQSADGGVMEQVPEAPEMGSRMADSLPTDVLPVAASSVPTLVYPEQRALRLDRELLLWDDDSETAMRERLLADGAGNFRLDVTAYRDDHAADWGPVPETTALMYQLRAPFLVRFRDLHLGHPTAYGANYEWFTDPKPHVVAGRACTLWSARSVHGYGGADLLVEDGSGLLLGWTMYGPDLQPQSRCTVLDLELDPEIGADVAWQHRDEVLLEDYTPSSHQALLGFSPRPPLYLPPGFYMESEHWASDGAGLQAYIARYHDGLRTLFVVERNSDADTGASQLIIDKVRRSRFGGQELVEGTSGGLDLYVIGGLPSDELHTVFGSLIY